MPSEERREAAKLGWELDGSETRFENKALKLREDRLRVSRKGATTVAYVKRARR